MSDDEEVASDVPPRYLFFNIAVCLVNAGHAGGTLSKWINHDEVTSKIMAKSSKDLLEQNVRIFFKDVIQTGILPEVALKQPLKVN